MSGEDAERARAALHECEQRGGRLAQNLLDMARERDEARAEARQLTADLMTVRAFLFQWRDRITTGGKVWVSREEITRLLDLTDDSADVTPER